MRDSQTKKMKSFSVRGVFTDLHLCAGGVVANNPIATRNKAT
jgi:hypothetical protein